jgi:hypothetical protein
MRQLVEGHTIAAFLIVYWACAAAVVAGLLDCSDADFCVFRKGERAAAGVVEEKGCEHEGLRRDMERMALEPGRMAGILDAMLPDSRV